jgi:hypothetical protein
MLVLSVIRMWGSRGLQGDVVYLGWPIAPSYTSPNAGLRGLSQWAQLCTHITWQGAHNTLEIHHHIFNLCEAAFPHIFYHSNKERNMEKVCGAWECEVDNESAIIRWTLPDPILPVQGARKMAEGGYGNTAATCVGAELRMWKHECRGVEKLWTWHHILSHGSHTAHISKWRGWGGMVE